MFNHWATGLRSGLLLQDCEVGTPESVQRSTKFLRSFREGFDFWSQGMIFWWVSAGSRTSPAGFLQGLAPPVVRWEVNYIIRKNLSPTSWKFGRGQKIVKCSKLAREAPRAIQKIQKKIGPKRALGPILGPGSLYYSRSTRLSGPLFYV